MIVSRRKKRAAIGFIFIGFLALLLFFSVDRYLANQAEIQRLSQEKAKIQPRPQNTHTIQRETRSRERRYSAQILPWMEAEVPAEVSGRVTEVHVEPGSSVQAGDVIVCLDPKTAQINLRASEARLSEARRLYEEAQRLFKEEVISRTEYEARRSEFEVSQAERDAAKQTYDQHFIKAPFSGVINERLVDVGDPVDANGPVATLVDLDKLRVVFYVNDRDILAMQPGQDLELEITGLEHLDLQPRIEFVSRSADPETRLFRIEAVLETMKRELPGGLQGTVNAKISNYREVPFVPTSAVRLVGDKATVLRIGGSERGPEITEVEIGPEIDGFYPVIQGLQEGDEVIIR